MSKVNNKDTKRPHWRRFGVFIVNIEHSSHLCSSVSIVNFEQVNSGWDNNGNKRYQTEPFWLPEEITWSLRCLLFWGFTVLTLFFFLFLQISGALNVGVLEMTQCLRRSNGRGKIWRSFSKWKKFMLSFKDTVWFEVLLTLQILLFFMVLCVLKEV